MTKTPNVGISPSLTPSEGETCRTGLGRGKHGPAELGKQALQG